MHVRPTVGEAPPYRVERRRSGGPTLREFAVRRHRQLEPALLHPFDRLLHRPSVGQRAGQRGEGGGQGSGPALVLAHGAGAGVLGDYGLVLDDLARDRTVIGPHYPGASGTPEAGRPLRLDDLADQLAAAATAAGQPPAAWRTASPAPRSPNCPARATS
ncbi:hypothetical protein OEIGOIKO_07766 [Streptomyces chrestomyceticus JCM 4735]|uniref:Uncharacterized protein n=1 Tax=Streptomyces chrestomyceticus JCM 4735 TaxID=1306181 RepID=A0A7U9Q4Z2_9ACTN|nr:hypothetical protein [Streptomyces chrestomyceticus]GCD39909.1 hypothetical protein OEIGOIKO_07766 [Streptomyces chrestomyceticus JCM 4735]